jgi:hypothetical protein
VALLRTLAIVLLAVVVTGVPTLACFVPDAQLTAEERECCRQMADKCGAAGMPSSHSCCKTVLRGSEDASIADHGSKAPVVDVLGFVPALLQPADSPFPATAYLTPSPPGSLPSATSVLRI